jgi:hypothetical protein
MELACWPPSSKAGGGWGREIVRGGVDIVMAWTVRQSVIIKYCQ